MKMNLQVHVINIKIYSQEQLYCSHMFIYIKGKITEIIRAQVQIWNFFKSV